METSIHTVSRVAVSEQKHKGHVKHAPQSPLPPCSPPPIPVTRTSHIRNAAFSQQERQAAPTFTVSAAAACFPFTSLIAALMASSASIEQ